MVLERPSTGRDGTGPDGAGGSYVTVTPLENNHKIEHGIAQGVIPG